MTFDTDYGAYIPDYCRKVLAILNDAGYEAYVVGGAVRDMIGGTEPADYDLATSAVPEEIIEAMREAGIKSIMDHAAKHGTITVMADGHSVEITTFRTDGEYSDNRRPDSVTFTRDLETDASRRDFTMNALYLGTDGVVTDPVNGKADIEAGIIRAVGDPQMRFAEDALRILRALRLASMRGYKIEDNTACAMRENAHLLKNISGERIHVEFTGIVTGRYASPIIREYLDILGVIIPELLAMKGFDQHSIYHHLDVLEHTLAVLDGIPIGPDGKRCEDLAIASLFHDIGKPETFRLDGNGEGHMKEHPEAGCRIAGRVADELRFPNRLKENVLQLILLHDVFVKPDRVSVHRLMTEYPPYFLDELAILQRADILAHSERGRQRLSRLEAIEEIRRELTAEGVCTSIRDLAVNGNDLTAAGIPAGQKIGIALKELMNAVIEETVSNSHDELIEYALKHIDLR